MLYFIHTRVFLFQLSSTASIFRYILWMTIRILSFNNRFLFPVENTFSWSDENLLHFEHYSIITISWLQCLCTAYHNYNQLQVGASNYVSLIIISKFILFQNSSLIIIERNNFLSYCIFFIFEAGFNERCCYKQSNSIFVDINHAFLLY